ncbi:hypothetical protein [Tritonibacter mobilis]|uniref:Uncharacterized protein n=1 Tax=Tritonibacter mobilis F1926 TaxID=1265309 RepID=A0A1B1A5U0_9RHOB|nr:hypothetical protein [Tritonibacter mobilis]ANP41887.1 hypothetical protein K529_014010 [Tritonibacter mobilis F1926]KJZ26079.1 hypothetical protein TW79_02865 [Tritonibacter mobilis]
MNKLAMPLCISRTVGQQVEEDNLVEDALRATLRVLNHFRALQAMQGRSDTTRSTTLQAV